MFGERVYYDYYYYHYYNLIHLLIERTVIGSVRDSYGLIGSQQYGARDPRRLRVVSLSVSKQPVKRLVDKLKSRQASPAGMNHGECAR